ncbi:MAG: oligosaccharide flippase family protein [Gemmobacter sp.]|nr:oligosaccharide flippase family protein [Gemmobacter sp.]
MTSSVLLKLAGGGLFARAMRGSAFTALGYVTSQAVRLASNLILTRLLFPEAFGLMALVTVFMVGLAMFSDVGLGPSIMQNKRGDDPHFLDTAWTIQVIRGAVLWLGTCALALPVAAFYGAPALGQLLPVAGLTLLIAGFNPTRIETANRHLALGLVTLLDLASQVVGIAVMVAIAMATGSVWALVWGGIAGQATKLLLTTAWLPGTRNRFRWDRAAATELVRFGKWIFLSTACGFLLTQGDKAILGRYLSLESLGVYNIGYFLASFPMLLAGAVTGRVLIPLYRDSHPGSAPDNARKLRRMRYVLSATIAGLLALMALIGVPLVGLLYDARYAAAGGIVVLIACLQMPQMVGQTYDQAALAAGDSRSFFLVMAGRAAMQTALFLLGAEIGGLVGALAGQALASVLVYPAVVWLARKHGAWDAWHDLVFWTFGLSVCGLSLWVNWAAIAILIGK